MNLPTIRRSLLAALAVLAVVAVPFYLRQNAGLQVGGEISPPKMLWLAWVIAAWFVVPPFLWRDARLEPGVRRLFGVFWGAMMVRGIAEMIAIYAFGHWHPALGISHDVFCLVLVLVLRRSVLRRGTGSDAPNRHALRYSTTLMVSLVAETAFAGMFLQTGAHAEKVYFASAGASWGFINLVTVVVLCFVVPDFVAVLTGLYFPGDHEFPLRLRRPRTAAAVVTALVAMAALGFWTWMAGLEAEADRYARVGFEIHEACGTFAAHFQSGDEDGMADFIAGGDGSWEAAPAEHGDDFTLLRWREGGPRRDFLDTVLQWRRDFGEVLQAAFKIHLIDEVVSEREAVAQLRFEITGRYTSDHGLIRARLRRGEDARWRIIKSSLIEGWSAKGRGDHFVDAAARKGLDFTMMPDRRFTPDESCASDAECEGPRRIKFETMRHAYAGSAAADFDGDGWDDVFLCSGGHPALFRNLGGDTAGVPLEDGAQFEDVTAEHPFRDLWHISTAGFADLDNDGDQDLFLGAYYGRNYLFENDGSGHFTDVSEGSGVETLDMLTVFSFFDSDNDGDLDLYLGRYLDARTEIPGSFLYARNGMPDRLYENLGGLRFRDITEQAGVGDVGLALSLAAADYDGDGDQDLYVANDFGRNTFYQNQGDGTFRDVALETGSFAISGSMSASWGDYDGDGRLDLYVAAIRSNQRWFVQPITTRRVVLKFLREGKLGPSNPLFSDLQRYMGDDWMEIGNFALAGNYLLRQRADGSFVDMAEGAGARPAGWYWSSAFLDFDHDGDLDVYATNGWITGKHSYDL